MNSLQENDPLIGNALRSEIDRQQQQIELIASENIVSQAVLDALGHPISNKTLEGYPGNRFHGGGEYADVIEQAAIDRARKLFKCDYVNVQPHSGTQANQAVFFALLNPGDSILSLNLAAGGHLSHGAKPNLSGKWFNALHYGVIPETGLIDYHELERIAETEKPALIITGGSAYPRQIDFERIADCAKSVGALFLVDMAHIAGLVAAGVHPSPIPFADIVTCTTTKTLRGPRGGLILCRDAQWGKKLQSSIFPGVQGSLHTQVIAAKAVCLGEALGEEFNEYGKNVIENARTLANSLVSNGVNLISNGTDTHLILIDLSSMEVTGQQLQDALETLNITSNKNPVPFDSPRPSDWKGLRLGVSAATTRGLGKAEFELIGQIVSDVTCCIDRNETFDVKKKQKLVSDICEKFPLFYRNPLS